MIQDRRRRRHALAALLPALATLLALLLGGCGSSTSQLLVRLYAAGNPGDCYQHERDAGAAAKPGEKLDYVLFVCNVGPGDANGVHLSLDLPADVQYEATTAIQRDPLGAARLSVVDPQVHATAPSWGTWHLDGPSRNADGTLRLAYVAVHFTVAVGGNPGRYSLGPAASDDAADGEVSGPATALRIDQAPDLHMDLSVVPNTVTRNADVLYRVTVDNLGTGPASGVNLLVTLPTGLQFLRTESISGNAGRSHPVNPVVGSLAAYYGGFVIPPRTQQAPGQLIVTLRAHCAFCIGGTYATAVQLTDADGAVLILAAAAPITVEAPAASPTPTPNPG